MHCRTCGCATHWEPIDPASGGKLGINARNFEPAVVTGVRIRRFDGAGSWTYVD